MELLICDNFEDAITLTPSKKYPELDILFMVYNKMKGYNPSPITKAYYQKMTQPLETYFTIEENYWKSFRKDLIDISKKFPQFYFVFTDTDNWRGMPVARYCFHNGKSNGGYVKVIYPEFKKEELENE